MNTDWKGLQRENSCLSNPFVINFAHHNQSPIPKTQSLTKFSLRTLALSFKNFAESADRLDVLLR
jgi:hypothetical protein